MTNRQRQLAFLRFMEIEAELEALAEGRVVEGDPANIKVTTPVDLSFAELLCR